MSARSARASQPSTAYELFILVLTVLSLAILVALVLPLSPATDQLLVVYDILICAVFLFDFLINLRRASPRREYLIGRRGWLDLLGSIPTLGFFKLSGLLRLVLLVVALVAAVLVILFLTDRRHQEVRRLPFLVSDLALVRGGEITFLGIAAGVSLLIVVGLAALFCCLNALSRPLRSFRTTTGSA